MININSCFKEEKQMERRVVITGMGAITPIGKDVEQTWKGIKEKKLSLIHI